MSAPTTGPAPAPSGLDHIREGYKYHNDQAVQLYPATIEEWTQAPSAADAMTAMENVLLAQCRDISIGPLTVHACIDFQALSFSVEVRLLGAVIGRCELSPNDQQCKIGGAVDGFKAEVNLNLDINPLRLNVSVQVCVPFLGCRTFGPFAIP